MEELMQCQLATSLGRYNFKKLIVSLFKSTVWRFVYSCIKVHLLGFVMSFTHVHFLPCSYVLVVKPL